MKLKIVLLVSTIALIGGFTVHMNQTKQNRCQNWFSEARDHSNQGYYGTAIEKLTLYFSTDNCRSSNDPAAVSLLTKARIKVPLPGNAHLAQQLMLSRHGWQLKRDPDHFLRIASASLAAGDWIQALSASNRSAGSKAALIGLASAVYLRREEAIAVQYDRLQNSDASALQLAVASILTKNHATTVNLAKAAIPERTLSLAHKVLDPEAYTFTLANARLLKPTLTNDDLAFATSLLAQRGENELAIELLDQPERPLPNNLLDRLANLLFVTKRYRNLALDFNGRSALETIPAKARLAICAAQILLERTCDTSFKEADFTKRYGKYAAKRWSLLFAELEQEAINPAKTVDMLEEMDDLLAGSGLALHIKGHLYTQLGEPELAKQTLQLAELYGYADQAEIFPKPSQDSVCEAGLPSCLANAVETNPYDLNLWRRALEAGYKPDHKKALLLQSVSPEAGTMWRTVIAQLRLASISQADTANALNLLRPVLKTAPTQATPHLLAATATAKFKDMDTAFMHLANAVKANPERTVEALRLIIGFYESDRGLTDSSLIRWWRQLTHLEMLARGATVKSDQFKTLLIDRLRIVASYCEAGKNQTLCIEAYRAILAVAPDNHMALNNLAYTLYSLNTELEEAAELADKAVTLAPTIGEYKATREEIQEAIAASEDAAA